MTKTLAQSDCDRIITINGVSIRAQRVKLRPRPDSTPSGQMTVPPCMYRVWPRDKAACSASIGDEITDGDLTMAITYIGQGPLKDNRSPVFYELRCE